MPNSLSAVSDTLYIPLLGRIYASMHHPEILYDTAALCIYDTLDPAIKAMPWQTEYTSLASAVRSRNIDHEIHAFLEAHPDGIIINVGCGLETIYWRCDNGTAIWYELDLPEVLALRQKYIPPLPRDRYLAYSMFDYTWMDAVTEANEKPVMIIAAGLLIYFPEDQVIDFLKHLTAFPIAEIVFDTVSAAVLKIARRAIDKMGKQNAAVYFYVNDAAAFTAKVSPVVSMISERAFYNLVDHRKDLMLSTRFRMAVSDHFHMLKMIHLKLYT